MDDGVGTGAAGLKSVPTAPATDSRPPRLHFVRDAKHLHGLGFSDRGQALHIVSRPRLRAARQKLQTAGRSYTEKGTRARRGAGELGIRLASPRIEVRVRQRALNEELRGSALARAVPV
jgi:hypothetical protein